MQKRLLGYVKTNGWNTKIIVSSLVLLISLISIGIYAYFVFIIANIVNILSYLFGVLGIITTLYNYYHKFYLFISRVRIILLNSNSTWNVNATYDGEFNEEIVLQLKQKILKTFPKAEIFEISKTAFQAYTLGLTIYIEYVDVEDNEWEELKGHLFLRVRDYNASYSLAMETLDEKIIPILTMVEHKTRPTNSMYNFKVEFGKNNPFMGLAVKNVDKASIVDFFFIYNKVQGVSRRNVKVSKKGIECTTNTLTDFQTASSNYLSLVGN